MARAPTVTSKTVQPGPRAGTVRDGDGDVVDVPDGWELLPPGDALVTRKVKAAGPHWVMVEHKRNKVFTRGVWAPAATITKATAAANAQRARPEHARQLEASRARRAREQSDYVVEFTRHVERFLAFHPRHAALARVMAERVAAHATPVGSGTVARTERIPVAERAEAAVIAWMRHQTTGYDHMHIARIKGERREVRKKLAQRSRELLARYRSGEASPTDCPLARALTSTVPAPAPEPVQTRARIPTPPEPVHPRARIPAPAPEPAPAATDEAERRRARMQAVRDRLKSAARSSRPSGA
ncbi:MAG: DUF2293 domain-containing protein [Deltaproteobacteria bacterium]|nr:DUF2293 domain-containing protein [Deltaproteobacteria bacterium]